MHSDLEEGEIIEEDVIEDKPDATDEWNSYFSTKGNNNILLGSFGKISREKEIQSTYSKDIVSAKGIQTNNDLRTYQPRESSYSHPPAERTPRTKASKCGRKNSKQHHIKTSKRKTNVKHSDKTMAKACSANLSDCSFSSEDIHIGSSAKVKNGYHIMEKQILDNNYQYNKTKHYRNSKYRKPREKSRNSSLYDHKQVYIDSFAKSISKSCSKNTFIKSTSTTFSRLKLGNKAIKPGSIGEMLFRREPKPPVEIILSDTDHASPPPKVKKVALSDDENLMILRKRALESFNKTTSNNLNEGMEENSFNNIENMHDDDTGPTKIEKICNPIPSIQNLIETTTNEIPTDKPIAELGSLPSNHNTSNVPTSIGAHYEPVDMEISLSDDESNEKKKGFPIQWAYMVPPPACKNDCDIHALKRWCYDQNMCVQAMQSTCNARNTMDMHSYQSLEQPNTSNSQSENIPGTMEENILPTEPFSNANLIGAPAKQYQDFMANFCKEKHSFKSLYNTGMDNKFKKSLKPNLIEVTLEPYAPKIIEKSCAASNVVDAEYDEDLLLATLLIDQEKRAQKRQEKKIVDNHKSEDPKPVDFSKKRPKKQANFKKKAKTETYIKKANTSFPISDEGSGVIQASNVIKYSSYKFPKVKPVIISLQSDSDNECDQKATCSNIDEFIRNIRNSNIEQNTLSNTGNADEKNPLGLDLRKTPKVLNFLSKNQKEEYQLLKEKLKNKLSVKSQLSRKKFLTKKNKYPLHSPTSKRMSPKKKIGKFNFLLDSSSSLVNKSGLPVVSKTSLSIVDRGIDGKLNENVRQESSINESSSFQAEVKLVAVAERKGITPDPSNNVKEPVNPIVKEPANPSVSELQTSQKNPLNSDNFEDDEEALRLFLLQSLGSNAKNICSDKDKNKKNQHEIHDIKSEVMCTVITTANSMCSKEADNNGTSLSSVLSNKCLIEPTKLQSSANTIDTCMQNSTNENITKPMTDVNKPCLTIEERSFVKICKANPDNTRLVEHRSATINNGTMLPKLDNLVKLEPISAAVAEKPSGDIELSSGIPKRNAQSRNKIINLPPSCDKNKTEESILLKHIEQDVVKERNKVFFSRLKLTQDIKKSERFFVESKAMLSVISSLKAQLLQAEQKLCSNTVDAENNLSTLYDKKSQLKHHMNRSKELQQMGEKVGKQILGQHYTFPAPSTNYDLQYSIIESDLLMLKKRVEHLSKTEKPNAVSGNPLKCNDVPAATLKKPVLAASQSNNVKKHIFKIDKRPSADKHVVILPVEQLKSNLAEPRPRTRSLNPESSSDADVLCPHDLLGRCNDETCVYIHLQRSAEEENHTSLKSKHNPTTPLSPPKPTSVHVNNISPIKPIIKSEPIDSCVNELQGINTIDSCVNELQGVNTIDSCVNECTVRDRSETPIKLKRVIICLNRLTKTEINVYTNRKISTQGTIKTRLRSRK